MPNNLNIASGIFQNATSTKAAWEATTDIIPEGMLCIETDTLGIRFGNGSDLYIDLPYTVQPQNPPA